MAAPTDTVLSGYRALTEGCGLVDRSERGKLALTGPDAKAFLQGQVTNDVEGLEPGQGCYAAFLTHKGKMLGDLRVLDLGDELLLDTERSALQELFNMIRRFKVGSDVVLHKRTLEMGLLSLIGPDSWNVVGAARLPNEHDNVRAEIGGRTGRCSSPPTSASTCSRRRRIRTRFARRWTFPRSTRRSRRSSGSSPAGRATGSTSTTA